MNLIIFKVKYIETVILYIKEILQSYIMTVRIIILKSNKKKMTKNMEKVKNIDQIQLSEWGYLWIAMEFL